MKIDQTSELRIQAQETFFFSFAQRINNYLHATEPLLEFRRRLAIPLWLTAAAAAVALVVEWHWRGREKSFLHDLLALLDLFLGCDSLDSDLAEQPEEPTPVERRIASAQELGLFFCRLRRS